MKVKVIKGFRDKHTKKLHKVNDILTVTKERYDEIIKKGAFVEEIKAEKSGNAPKGKTE